MAESRGLAGATAEWSDASTDFMLRTAGQSARTLQLSDQLLGCVARGQLAPVALRDSMSRFLQEHGAASTAKTAELSAQFFAGLLQSPGAEAPPEFDPADAAGWFRRLHDYALRQYATRNWPAVDDESRAPEQLLRAARLCLDFLAGLTELRTQLAEEYLRSVLAMVSPWNEENVLDLAAAVAATASASLSLTNTRPERAVVRCAVTDVRRADGIGPAFAPDISIIPDGFLLEPDQEATVRLSLRLDAGIYDPGAPYIGALQVTRHGEPHLEVQLRITARIAP
jgi:hypothetical protein